MQRIGLIIGMATLAAAGYAVETAVHYDFNDFKEGPVEGQLGWNVFEKVKDSSAFQVADQVGKEDRKGDKALLVKVDASSIRCITGEPVRWMPGERMELAFDFRVGIPSTRPIAEKPVLCVGIGNSLLSDKACWTVELASQTNGNWRFFGAVAGEDSVELPPHAIVPRPDSDKVNISGWYRFVLVVRKLSEPDSFWATAEITSQSGQTVARLHFLDGDKNAVTAAMWNLTRLHAGFLTSKEQLGLACIDNLSIEVSKLPESP